MNQPWVYMCSPSWPFLPLPSPSHPSGSSQCTSPEHPVLCIEPGLVIYFTYDNIHWHSFLNSNCVFTYCFGFLIRLKKPALLRYNSHTMKFTLFRVDSLVVLFFFTIFTNYAANNTNSKIFSSPRKETLCSLPVTPYLSSFPQLLATTNLFISVDLPVWGILYRWAQVICGLLWQTSFI